MVIPLAVTSTAKAQRREHALQYLDMDAAIAHCTKGLGTWPQASNDQGSEPDVVMATAGDIPTKDHLMVELAGYIFDRWDVRFHRDLPKPLTAKMDIFLYSIRYMIEENKRVKSSTLLLEMWAMANRSTSVMRMLDTFYAKMRSWIEDMLVDINPTLSGRKRRLRAALITSQIEGLMILVGPKRVAHKELNGLEDEAIRQIQRLAMDD